MDNTIHIKCNPSVVFYRLSHMNFLCPSINHVHMCHCQFVWNLYMVVGFSQLPILRLYFEKLQSQQFFIPIRWILCVWTHLGSFTLLLALNWLHFPDKWELIQSVNKSPIRIVIDHRRMRIPGDHKSCHRCGNDSPTYTAPIAIQTQTHTHTTSKNALKQCKCH